ncbi:MAG: Txe/YoeB family addiction module toxin [Emticicia sp.]
MKSTKNLKVQESIKQLLISISETPFSGIGKPEPLKHNMSGFWSRRIDRENRIVYEVKQNAIQIYSLKGHY